jgi:hypothetical protein
MSIEPNSPSPKRSLEILSVQGILQIPAATAQEHEAFVLFLAIDAGPYQMMTSGVLRKNCSRTDWRMSACGVMIALASTISSILNGMITNKTG